MGSATVTTEYVRALWGVRSWRTAAAAEAMVCWVGWVYGVPVARVVEASETSRPRDVVWYVISVTVDAAWEETTQAVARRLVTEWRLAGRPMDYAPEWSGLVAADGFEYGTVRWVPF